MAVPVPTLEEIESSIVELLTIEEVGALAVILENGSPHVATMHFAGDGLSVYCHTFLYTRKYEAIKRDPRVSYTLAYQPPGGFYDRMKLRAIQVSGVATFLEDQAEIEHAIAKCGEQFGWLEDSTMFDNFRREGVELRQVFFRIDPVSAMWNDNRVRMMWRQNVTFTPDGKHVAEITSYSTAVR
ncbi:pyridoxamine 5'-phosphate oxidase family protein [Rhodococcoides fascians]|uniref:pyridoxamine 5'-phosphate oxidase family protein n=1 Tax=Rhodococcoides fascians TaxID=1828 RepID=UPI00056B8BAD|nr:pyridoxamine 5'-phosphate oxidase family protein [Rhodococcus fascians]